MWDQIIIATSPKLGVSSLKQIIMWFFAKLHARIVIIFTQIYANCGCFLTFLFIHFQINYIIQFFIYDDKDLMFVK